jgi:hypothetical protein
MGFYEDGDQRPPARFIRKTPANHKARYFADTTLVALAAAGRDFRLGKNLVTGRQNCQLVQGGWIVAKIQGATPTDP